MRNAMLIVLGLALGCVPATMTSADWPRFRGPNGSAVSTESGLLTTWSDTENISWKLELPGPGSSSPVVAGNRVFVTCYSGYGVDRANPGDPNQLTRHLICVDLQEGRILWQNSVPANVLEDPYRGQLTEHGYASSTPATDGEHVFTFFGKSGVLGYDVDGKALWQTSVGTGSAIMGWGSAASLLCYQDLVIVNANAESQSLVALNKNTGVVIWKAEAEGYAGSWSTPVLVEADGKSELAVTMPGELWGLDPDNGGLLWYSSGVRGAATTSLVAHNGIVYAVTGGPGGSGVMAVRAGGRDDVSNTHVLWRKSVGSYVPSPVVVGEFLYWVDDRGVAYCLRTESGEQVYRERLPQAGGVYASVVAADGKLFVVSRQNGTFVLATGPEFKQLAHNRLESDTSDFNATPAVSNGRMLVRSNRFLYCIAAETN